MKRIAALLLVLLVANGCATRPTGQNPFASLEAACIAKIQVGDLSVNPETSKSTFTQYFEITDPKVVGRLVELVRDTGHKTDGWPAIGMLSYQRFLDASGRVLADTRIVNFDNTVVTHEPNMPLRGYWKCMQSPEYCRTIYDLMVKQVPQVIDSQRKWYKTMDRKLETLLFEGKDIKETARPTTPPYSEPAARVPQR